MKTSFRKHFGCLGVSCATLFLVGCSTPAHRIDPAGRETITTVGGLDIQDAADAATELSESLLAAGILGKKGQPSTVGIDQFVNATDQDIDRDYVLKQIRVALNKSGAAQTMTSVGTTGEIGGESAIASKAAKERLKNEQIDAFLNETEAPESLKPDYSLTFKILDNRVRAEGVQQVTYIFQMSLTDVKSGVAVWEDEKRISKQGTRAALGR